MFLMMAFFVILFHLFPVQIIDPRVESEFEEEIDGKFRRLVCNSVQMKHKGMYKCQCAALSSSGRVSVNRKCTQYTLSLCVCVCVCVYVCQRERACAM